MKLIDFIIIGFMAVIAISMIYNRIVQRKKALASGSAPMCAGCSMANKCSKKQCNR